MTIYNIPATACFVDSLARGVLERFGSSPMGLAAVTILLPNRRGVRALRDAFLRMTGGAPLLLPNIRPIGDVEEDALYLGVSDPAMAIPPAINTFRRKLVLAQYLCAAYPGQYTTAQALAMAAQLGTFLDSVETEGLSLDALDTLVPEQYATHWQTNLAFLKDVLRRFWPQQLEAEGVIGPALRRRLLIEAYTAALGANPPETPVIAAGSTGSIPVTAELLKTVAALPNGHVVLPGLDDQLEDTHWTDSLEDGHPQAGLARLLLHMGGSRADVVPWRPEDIVQAGVRARLISALMRPANAIGDWAQNPLPPQAFENISLLEADNIDEEATSIALMMRAHAEDVTQEECCVLVTPDRVLASRVSLMLGRWGILIDDSAGVPLKNTPVGAWLLLLCDVLENGLEPVSFLSLLKSPFAAGGSGWGSGLVPFRSFVRALDKHVLRGPRLEGGFAPLLAQAQKYPEILAGLEVLRTMFEKPVAASDTNGRLRALVVLAESLAGTPETHGSNRLWHGEAGEAMALCLADLFEQADVMPQLGWQGCRDILEAAMEGVSVRPRYGTHPRLAILGPMEARLYQARTMILASLNEGTWPKLPETDGWMSRQMRCNFGLPSPEKSITLSAHDFAQGFGAPCVVLTRSKNRDGAPTTASRWLQRLETLCEAQLPKQDLKQHAHKWLAMARALDAPVSDVLPAQRPAPNPPLHTRPRKMSVTEIAKWRRDPYYVYAKHVLRLRRLDPIAQEPDAAERGTLIHEILKEFAERYPTALPDNALDILVETGRRHFEAARQHPDVTGHWWPRFLKMASAFIRFEEGWRSSTIKVYPEVAGALPIALNEGFFTLEGRADRIENRSDGWVIVDYKSGEPPAKKRVESGEEPQLTLLGHMLLSGCFNEAIQTAHTPAVLDKLAYWKTGGSSYQLDVTEIKNAEGIPDEARAGLEDMVRAYTEHETPYVAWPDSENKLRDDYEYSHLARIAEWANADDEGEEAA